MSRAKPFVVWFTGLPCSGKSTLAAALHSALAGAPVEILDGDLLRAVFPETGFSRPERERHLKHWAYTAALLEKNGTAVIAAFVSPYGTARAFARGAASEFVEVYLSTALEECIRRDVKGLYQKALRGEIDDFTGITDSYEAPEYPEITIDTANTTIEAGVEQILRHLSSRGLIQRN